MLAVAELAGAILSQIVVLLVGLTRGFHVLQKQSWPEPSSAFWSVVLRGTPAGHRRFLALEMLGGLGVLRRDAPSSERKARAAERSGGGERALGSGLRFVVPGAQDLRSSFPDGTLRSQKTCPAGLVVFSAGHVVSSDRCERSRQVPWLKPGIRSVPRVSRRHPP